MAQPFLALITPLSDAHPSHPISLPGDPGFGQIPGFTPGTPPPRPQPQPPVYPSHPIYYPPYPDQGLPGGQPYPDQGLPGAQPHPEHPIVLPPSVPVTPEHPWVPPTPAPPVDPGYSPPWATVPDAPDGGGGHWVWAWLPGAGWRWVRVPGKGEAGPKK